VTKNRRAPCYKINPSGVGRNSVLLVLIGTLILFFLAGCATSPQSNSQTMVHETGRHMMPFDLSKTIRMFWMTESGDVQRVVARDQRDNGQVTFIQEHPQQEAGLFGAGDFSDQGASYGTDTSLLFSSNDSLSEVMGSDRGYTLPSEEKALSNQEKKALSDPSRDWKGIGRDTAYFMGYQVVIAGVLYTLPESVTKWTDEQKRAKANNWAENVQNPTWDKDPAWINYLGHPYWGATYYIRARERGFGEFGSFWYSAFLSALYEFGIEAFFEQPSYQDLIVTPVGGILIGKFVFEPIRASIKSKTELTWSDHLLLILTDPLGAANSVVDRSLGIKSNVRLTIPGLTPLRPERSSYHTAKSLKRQDENRSRQHGFGIGFDLMW
jgi:hypothetical protein